MPLSTLSTKTAKSAKRIIAMAFLSVFATAGLVAYAAGGRPDWNIAPSPASQTVAAGQSAVFTIQLTRMNGFAGAVTLSASNLPAATKATFETNPIPAPTTSTQANSSKLTIATNAGGTTPTGTHPIYIVGKAGNTTKSTAVSLSVQPPEAENFNIEVMPSIRYIAQNDDAEYEVRIARSGGWNGSVTLGTHSLPDRISATFDPPVVAPGSSSATLRVHSEHNAQDLAHSFAVLGTGTIGANSVTRFGAVGLNVETTKPFTIQGDLSEKIGPDSSSTLDLQLTNPHRFAIRLANLSVALDDTTSLRTCSALANLAVTQIKASRLDPATAGVWVPARSTRTLTQLGVLPTELPKVTMLNRTVNQDGCKNARFTFQYSGEARK